MTEAVALPAQSGVQVAAFYRFARLDGLSVLRAELQALAAAQGVLGTILLASEGVNGTIAGGDMGVEVVLARLRQVTGLELLVAKCSRANTQPFHRLKVRLKREIVTMGRPDVAPYLSSRVGTHVPPEHWDGLIADPNTLVIDTRNAYEVAIGTFAGAIDPGTESFREFPNWVERQLRPLVAQRQPKAIAMFCTGGIRCEKATAYLQQQGLTGVHHLQGGILGYLEEIPAERSSWRGECFVFDQRVAVNHRLEPGEYRLCFACGLPLSPEDRQLVSYKPGVSCRHCIDRFTDTDRERFAERQRQIERAQKIGNRHRIGAGLDA
jgi:UPF0176 protein